MEDQCWGVGLISTSPLVQGKGLPTHIFSPQVPTLPHFQGEGTPESRVTNKYGFKTETTGAVKVCVWWGGG